MNEWIKNAVFYEIYPTSFCDGNGDGIGDFIGMKSKIQYVKSLGVDAVWLNPFYKSPFMDGGYDIEDYYSVDPKFGTMADFEAFMKEAKKAGLRIILDLVIGHTSDKHKWFLRSAEDNRNEYSDRYIWTDVIFTKYKDKTIHGLYPRDGGYFANYYACQPALNFGFLSVEDESWQMHYTDERLRPLREEILNIMRFWMNKGADGFRVDLASSLVKGTSFDDVSPEKTAGIKWLWNRLIPPMRAEYPDICFIAEWENPSVSVGEAGFDLDFILHDEPTYNDLFRNEKGTNIIAYFEKGHSYFSRDGMGSIDGFFDMAEKAFEKTDGKGFISVPSGVHDLVRIAEKRDADDLKAVFAFLLSFKHVPFIYYGDEIGMKHRFGVNKDGGYIRTGARTPMQWNDGKNMGFSDTGGELYLPVNNDGAQTVKANDDDGNSLLNTVRKLIALRKEHSCLNADGAFRVVRTGYPVIYERSDAHETITVYINPSDKTFAEKLSGAVIYSENCEICENRLMLGSRGFAFVKK